MNKGPWGGRGAEFLKSGGVVGWKYKAVSYPSTPTPRLHT